jgi:hypothetical protein
MAKVDWNTGAYETGRNFEVMPKGRYLALLTDSERVQTKAKNGHYFEFEFDVVRPENFKNRKLWARLNTDNPSAEAQRIGREQFNALCEACGIPKEKVTDTALLHNKLVVCIVDIEKSIRNPNQDVNAVKGWLKATEADSKLAADHKAAPKHERKPAGEATAATEARREEARKARAAGAFSGQEDDDIPF